MSGSVQVKRMTPLRPDVGLTPGRRRIVDVSFIKLKSILPNLYNFVLDSTYKPHTMCIRRRWKGNLR